MKLSVKVGEHYPVYSLSPVEYGEGGTEIHLTPKEYEEYLKASSDFDHFQVLIHKQVVRQEDE